MRKSNQPMESPSRNVESPNDEFERLSRHRFPLVNDLAIRSYLDIGNCTSDVYDS